VIVALPNFQHLEAVKLAAEAGKAILVTKPLGRNAAEAKEMLELVEKHGVFHGYLEDLCYTPKTLKAVESVKNGALGNILWVRARETHPGPHSDWFWNSELSAEAEPLSIWAVTASRLPGTTLESRSGPWRSCAGPIPR
jgi:predicted dehydrogenase